MQRIVVGVDQSETAGAALAWAASVASALRLDLIAVNAFQPTSAEVAPDVLDRMLDAQCDTLDRCWTTPARASGVPIRTIVHPGSPQQVLLAAAADESADLVVLGRSSRGGEPGRLHLGSVAEYHAHHSDRPLAVIPSGFGLAARRIIVGVDGSANSLQSATWAARLAEAFGASVTAIAIDSSSGGREASASLELRRRISAWSSPLAGIGVKIDIVSAPDTPPADGLLAEASKRDADLLVLGARGVGPATGVRLGGTALRTLHHVTIPYVMVPIGTNHPGTNGRA